MASSSEQEDFEQHALMVTVLVYIVFLEYVSRPVLSNFASRKLCHSGCGGMMMMLNPTRLDARCFVWAVAVSSIAMTWNLSPLPAFRFSRPHDVGVTAYLLLVSAWFYLRLPVTILAPVFFADPAGAVVGKLCSHLVPRLNPTWCGRKTVLGSAAVLGFTYVSITFPCSATERTAIAVLAAIAEALGGDYDNLALAAVVLGGWRWTAV
jgi:hypothetical protein